MDSENARSYFFGGALVSGLISFVLFCYLMNEYNTANFYLSIYRYYPCTLSYNINQLAPQFKFMQNTTEYKTCYKYLNNDDDEFIGEQYKVQQWLWAPIICLAIVCGLIVIKIKNVE